MQNIDFPKCWAAKLKIRSILPLSDDLSNKIKIVHRLGFYRENILDLMKETNLEQMLVMVGMLLFRRKWSLAKTSFLT